MRRVRGYYRIPGPVLGAYAAGQVMASPVKAVAWSVKHGTRSIRKVVDGVQQARAAQPVTTPQPPAPQQPFVPQNERMFYSNRR